MWRERQDETKTLSPSAVEGVEEALTENCGDALRHGIGEESTFGGSVEGRRATASFGAAAISVGVEKEESFKGESRLSSPRVEAAMDR